MQEETLYTTFERYLENEMTPEDKIEFERLLQDDKEVRKAFKLYKEAAVFVAHKFSPATDAFKENLKSISKEHFSHTTAKKSRIISFKPWLYAVAACLLLFFGLQLFQGIAPSFEDYNQPEKAAFVERGNLDQNVKQAQESFNAQKYKEAILLFENIIQVNPKPEFSYFYAIALLEENNSEKAEIEFTKLKNGNTIYKQNAIWYLALSKLKQKEYKECKTLLAQITTESDYYEKAQQLLEELK
jgi:predicted Zn-dependent protease